MIDIIFFLIVLHTVCFRMSSGYYSNLPNPGRGAEAYCRVEPGYDRVLDLHPKDVIAELGIDSIQSNIQKTF